MTYPNISKQNSSKVDDIHSLVFNSLLPGQNRNKTPFSPCYIKSFWLKCSIDELVNRPIPGTSNSKIQNKKPNGMPSGRTRTRCLDRKGHIQDPVVIFIKVCKRGEKPFTLRSILLDCPERPLSVLKMSCLQDYHMGSIFCYLTRTKSPMATLLRRMN